MRLAVRAKFGRPSILGALPCVAVQNVPASYLHTVAVTEVNAPNALYYVQAEHFREYRSTLCYGQANRALNDDRRRGVS
jgi:hypothetical protein